MIGPGGVDAVLVRKNLPGGYIILVKTILMNSGFFLFQAVLAKIKSFHSPELGTDLVTALASLDVDDLTARRRRIQMSAASQKNDRGSAGEAIWLILPHGELY